MARLPRLYRVTGRKGSLVKFNRNYLTPKAADERKIRLEESGHEVSVEPSYPVTWPHVFGDQARLPMPDSTISRESWEHFASVLGLEPAAIEIITRERSQLVIQFRPTPESRRRPEDTPSDIWRVEVVS